MVALTLFKFQMLRLLGNHGGMTINGTGDVTCNLDMGDCGYTPYDGSKVDGSTSGNLWETRASEQWNIIIMMSCHSVMK